MGYPVPSILCCTFSHLTSQAIHKANPEGVWFPTLWRYYGTAPGKISTTALPSRPTVANSENLKVEVWDPSPTPVHAYGWSWGGEGERGPTTLIWGTPLPYPCTVSAKHLQCCSAHCYPYLHLGWGHQVQYSVSVFFQNQILVQDTMWWFNRNANSRCSLPHSFLPVTQKFFSDLVNSCRGPLQWVTRALLVLSAPVTPPQICWAKEESGSQSTPHMSCPRLSLSQQDSNHCSDKSSVTPLRNFSFSYFWKFSHIDEETNLKVKLKTEAKSAKLGLFCTKDFNKNNALGPLVCGLHIIRKEKLPKK